MTFPEDHIDELVAAGLADLPVDEHQHGFWQRLEAELAGSVDRSVGSGFTGTTVGVDDDAVVHRLDEAAAARQRHRPIRRLVLAAVAAVLLVGGWMAASEFGEDSRTETGLAHQHDEQQSETPTSTPDDDADVDDQQESGLFDYLDPSEAVAIGTGSFIGFTDDGESLLVLDAAPGGGTGSEGAPLLTVWIDPLDGSDRRAALPSDVTVETATTGSDFEIDGSRIAWVEWCDGVPCRFRTGSLAADGAISDVTDIPIPDPPDLDREVFIGDLAFGADGMLHVNSNGYLGVVEPGASAIEVMTDVPVDTLAAFEDPTAGRTVVYAIGDRVALLPPGDAAVDNAVQGRPTAIAGTTGWPLVFVGTDTGTFWAVDLGTGEVDDFGTSSDQAVLELAVSPDNRALIVGNGSELTLGVNIDDAVINLSQPGLAARGARFSPDGGAVAYTVNDWETSPSVWYVEFGSEPLPSVRPVPDQGIILGASPDGEWDIYAVPDPATTGCEGEGAAYRLWRTAAGGGEGVTEPVIDGNASFSRPPDYVRGPDDQVALIDSCEEVWIQVGRETVDGRIEGLRAARPPGYDEYFVRTIRWDDEAVAWSLTLFDITSGEQLEIPVDAEGP